MKVTRTTIVPPPVEIVTIELSLEDAGALRWLFARDVTIPAAVAASHSGVKREKLTAFFRRGQDAFNAAGVYPDVGCFR